MNDTPAPHRAPLALPAAWLAGAAAWIAEITWMRAFGRTLGAQPEAIGALASLALLGLGLGAWLGAIGASGLARPARRAAFALIGAGLLMGASPLYLQVLPDLSAAIGRGPLASVLLALPLVVPTFLLLGLLVPALVRLRVKDLRGTGRGSGGVLAAQTLGGLVGLGATLAALPLLGEDLWLQAAGAALLVGAILMLLSDRPLPHGSDPAPRAVLGRQVQGRGVGPAIYGIGMCLLMAELAWIRMLAPILGDHLVGIAAVLGAMLLAQSIGAALGGVVADRARRPEVVLGRVLTVTGALLVASIFLAGRIPGRALQGPADGQLVQLLLGTAWAIAPAALLAGLALPLAIRVRADCTGRAARAAGRMVAWNAVGAVTGALLAAGFTLPSWGAAASLLIAGGLLVATAVLLRLRTENARVVATLVHALPLALLAVPGATATILDQGPKLPEVVALRRPRPPGLTLRDGEDVALYARYVGGQPAVSLRQMDALPYPPFEGLVGTVALLEEPGGLVGLRRSGARESIVDPATPTAPPVTEAVLGLLPVMMHPEPTRALVIGHGAGWTAEAVLRAGVSRVVIAEIDVAMLEAARAARGLEALPAQAHARATLRIEDGGALLREAARGSASERYDIIVSQPSQAWSPTSAHLFAREPWERARAALRPGGVFAQWLSLAALDETLLRDVLATFRGVFPHTWLLRFPGEVVLVGYLDAPRVEPDRWERLLAEGSPSGDFARRAGLSGPSAVWKHFGADGDSLDERIGPDAVPLLEKRPRLELTTGLRRLDGSPQPDLDAWLNLAFPPDWERALPDPDTRTRWNAGALRAWADSGRVDVALGWEQRVGWPIDPVAISARADVLLAGGLAGRALGLVDLARRQAPDDPELAVAHAEALGTVSAGARTAPRLRAQAATALADLQKTFPEDGPVLAAIGRAYSKLGQTAAAASAYRSALAIEGDRAAPPGTGFALARLLLSSDPARAEEEALRLLRADPQTYEDPYALELLIETLGLSSAEADVEPLMRALEDVTERRGLRLIQRARGAFARGNYAQARDVAERALRTWPASSRPHLVYGLSALAAAGGEITDDLAQHVRLELREAVARAEGDSGASPEAVRTEAERILGWFGIGPLDAAAPDSE